ncbi:MAG: hypothetical protein ABMA26_06465 [Limisphaerales bacterium]
MTARSCLLLFLFVGLATAAAQTVPFSTSTTAPTAPTAKGGPRPIDVLSSGGSTLNITNGLVTYSKNVRVNDPQFFLRCESLHLLLDLKRAKGAKPPDAAAATNSPPLIGPTGSFLIEVDATGGILFSNKADGSYAVADRGRYFATNDAFELTGNAQLVKKLGGDNIVTNSAPRIMFFRAQGLLMSYGESSTGGKVTPPNTNSPAKKP